MSPARLRRAEAGRVVFVDSRAWVAPFSACDENYGTAEVRFRCLVWQGASLLTTSLIVAEVHQLVLHWFGPPAAAAVLGRLDVSSALRIVFPTHRHHTRARAWLKRFPDARITCTDAMSFAVMEDEGCCTAASFDNDFVRAGFVRWS